MADMRFLSATVRTLMVSVALGSTMAVADAGLNADLERVAPRRILFGHQSVGANVLDGIQQLAQSAGVPLRITEASTATKVGAATFGHVPVAENGNPLKKFESFEVAMGQESTSLDIALVKLCYVDFSADTDAKALFAKYRETISRLRSRHPGTTFVHVTAPLTDVQGGPRALAKRLVGRAPYGVLENMRRNEYNELIRQTYSGREPIFDLARVESSEPDGRPVTVDWNGKTIPALAPQYTNDGGHLNAVGRLHAARELISILAAVPERIPAAKSVH